MPIRRVQLSFITVLLFSSLFAQTKLDSLISSLNNWPKEKQDSNLYNTYYDVIKMTYGKNMDTCQHFLNESLDLATKIDFKPGLQRSSYLLAIINSKKGDYKNSLELLSICIQANPQSLNRHMRCLKMKGDINRKKTNYNEAKKYYDEAEEYGISANDTVFLGNLYNSRAILYEDLSQLDKSVENYLRSAEIDRKRGDLNGYFFSIINIASMYENNKDINKAEYYVNSLRSKLDTLTDMQQAVLYQHEGVFSQERMQYDEALIKFTKSLELLKKIDFKPLMAVSYINIGLLQYGNAQFEIAYDNFSTGLDYVQEEPRRFNFYTCLANSKIMMGDCSGANEWIEKAKVKVGSIKNYLFLRRYYTAIGKYYACTDKPKLSALAIEDANTYSDSFYLERREIEANKIEAKYQAKIKTDSISILSLQNDKQNVEISRRNVGLVAGSIILILLGLLTWYFIKLSDQRKQLNSFLESKNEELVFQNNELQNLNEQLEQKTKSLSVKPKLAGEQKELSLKTKDKTYFIPLDKVTYVQAEDDGVRVYYDDTSKWTDVSLKIFHQELEDDSFVQIGKGVVVNVKHIAWINTNTLKMKAGAELKIGRVYKPQIKKILES